MPRNPIRRAHPVLPLVLSLALPLSLAACDRDKATEPEPEPSPYLDPTSAEAVLTNLITAYERRDAEAYADLFTTADFLFVFDPIDVAQDPRFPPTWEWTDEITSTTTMFGTPDVLDIRLDFVIGSVTDPAPNDQPRGDGWKKVTITEVDLEVETKDPQGGEDIIYKVAGDRAHFFFVVDPEETVGGDPVWRIVEWRDEHVGGLATIENTWGSVKFLYH